MYAKFPKNSNDYKGILYSGAPILKDIKASSTQANTIKYIGNIVNYNHKESIWCSRPIEYSYFIISFVQPITITNLSFRVKQWESSPEYPLALKVEGYQQNNVMEAKNINESGINPNELSVTIPTNIIGPFDMLKITQTSKNYFQRDFFCLSKFDIFGYTSILAFKCRTIKRIPHIDCILFTLL